MVYLGTCVPRAMLLTLSPNVVEHSQAIKTVSVLIRTAAPDCKHPSSPVGIADPWHSYTEGHGEDTEPSPESQLLLVDIWMSFCPNFKWPLEVLEKNVKVKSGSFNLWLKGLVSGDPWCRSYET